MHIDIYYVYTIFTCRRTHESKHTCEIVAKFYDTLKNIAKFGVINEVNFALTRQFGGISGTIYVK